MGVVAATTGKDRSKWAVLTRILAKAWGTEPDSNAEQAPLALSNEAIISTNNAGTGYVSLIKANAADITEFPNTNGCLFDGPVTFASGAGISEKVTTATITTAGAATYTAAQLDNNIILRDCNGGSRSDVTPTAALFVANIPGAVVGSATRFWILNNTASDLTITLTAGAGVTLAPTVITIPRLQFHGFIAICTNVTAAAEAVTIYSVLENGLRLIDAGGNPVLELVPTASAVNDVSVGNAATGNPVVITAGGPGSDATVGVTINSKGAAAVTIAPGAAGGTIVVGKTDQTGQITVGSSSGVETVVIADGAGAPTVNVANTSTAGATVAVAGAATASGLTDTVTIGAGNAVATAAKKVNILTGTPGTAGNNQLVVGGTVASAKATVKATATAWQAWNYIATESGANNALVATLTDAAGNNITVAAGLMVHLKLAHTIQAGANTFNLNAHGTDAIKKASAPGTDVAVVGASGTILTMIFDGTVWQVVGQ